MSASSNVYTSVRSSADYAENSVKPQLQPHVLHSQKNLNQYEPELSTSLSMGDATINRNSPLSPLLHRESPADGLEDVSLPSSVIPSPQLRAATPQNAFSRQRKTLYQQSNASSNSPRFSQLTLDQSSDSYKSRSTSPLESKYIGSGKDSANRETLHSLQSTQFSSNGTENPSLDSGPTEKYPLDSSTPIKESHPTDLFLKLKSSQIVKNASKSTPTRKLLEPASLKIPPPKFNDAIELDDSLNSPGSELGVLEDFVPETETHSFSLQSGGIEESESFMKDNTDYLVDRATSYKQGDASIQNDDLPIGVKKEKAVIDSLKQEIFQLKLHIVIMETQMNTSSNAGVAQLKSRLAESEAARISMKNENDKLRRTMASLDEEETDDSKDKCQALEEELLEYEVALGEAQDQQEYLKVFFMLFFLSSSSNILGIL